ncbi:MAG TPA: PQQ-dependent dehydrogenase, methanol/ethanol family [Streptosporangiaceae bacterium]|jgi:alcohol dehydrogenase (cytochrome c)|nr:PQQ-dependent dehydrogenase, methanol/ethanol family [Streptosporangiaceae bacterium]
MISASGTVAFSFLRLVRTLSFVLGSVAFCLLASSSLAQVTSDRLLNSSKEPQNWLLYSGDYAGHRYSALDQINAKNAAQLVPKWVYQTMAGGKFETTPLVVDGVLYGTGPDDRAFALDARSGRPIWQYQRALPADVRPCCGRVNRGFAILGDKVFMGTLDSHVIALDAKTGNVVWDVTAVDYTKGYSFTLAPLAIKGMILVGISGGEYGIRGFIDAYDADTGERKWRFHTIPGPGEPGHDTWEGDSWKIGGSPAWITGTYDPETNTSFWTTGNPSPSNRGIGRAGDNLYADSLLALDPDTGKLKWYFQFTRHDEHDYDATQVPVIIDDGDKKLIAQADRNGFFYVLDRATGKLISATAYAKVSWSKERDSEGRPIPSQDASPTPDGNRVCPGAAGATNWMSPTYDPQTKLFYVTAREQCDVFSTAPQPYEAGHAYYGSAYFPNEDASPFWGALRALDPHTGKLVWEWKHPSPTWSGVLSTAGGLVFTGDAEGNFIALDATTGKALWHFQCGASVYASPMSFAVDGKQYVAIAAGAALFTFSLP